MGELLNSKEISEGKILHKVLLSEQEVMELKNHAKNVYIFSRDKFCYETTILERGNKKGAKYFFIPKSLKSRKKHKFSKISYQKLETSHKVFYISVVEKEAAVE